MFNSRRARLEIDLPTGISIVFDADGTTTGKPMSRPELMARMRAAIGATDWDAVKALYGERPLALDGAVQVGGPAATSPRRVQPPSPKPAGQSSGESPAVRSVASSP